MEAGKEKTILFLQFVINYDEVGDCFLRDHLPQQYRLSSMCSGIGSMAVSSSFSTITTFYWSCSVIRLMARPICPKRPLRPILCRQVGGSLGKSKFMTTLTLGTSIPRDTRLELINVLNSPLRKRSKIFNLSSFILEVRYSFSKPLLFIFLERNSALLLDLQKMMHWLTMSSLQILYKYWSFSDSSTRMQQWVRPSSMSSSIRFITFAVGMKFCLKLLMRMGNVAEYRYKAVFLGKQLMISSMSYSVLSLSRLSAQSRTKNSHRSKRVFLDLSKSFSLPAVQMAKWTYYCSSFWWSSRTDFPPIKESIFTPLNLPNWFAISWTWWANSRVLTMTTAWILGHLTSISFRRGMRQAAVLPVPFLALAMAGVRQMMRGIDSS